MGRGKSEANLELIDKAHDILAQIHPASIRAVCYQLFIAGIIESMDRNCTNRVSKQLTDAREDGSIPWDWIVDETRRLEREPVFATTPQYIEAATYSYRLDPWMSQPTQVEVLSEKGTVRGTLAPILKKYRVGLRVFHGYGSATTVHEVAEESQGDDRQRVALYVGDHDPSGLHMSEVDLPNRFEKYGGLITLKRVALIAEDTRNGLPSFKASTKKKDRRYRWYRDNYGNKCWELDALSPLILRDRVERAIEELIIDREAWDRFARGEEVLRQSLTQVLERWERSKCGPASK